MADDGPANVVRFWPPNFADNPDNVLEQSKGAFDAVLLLGWDKDGNMCCRASTNMGDGGEILWLIERFKFALLSGAFEGEE